MPEGLRESFNNLAMPQKILYDLSHGGHVSYQTHFVTFVDPILPAPTDASVATHDLRLREPGRGSQEGGVTWWHLVGGAAGAPV